jgi:transmembrane 9 superfamily protein 2/4
VLYLGYLFLASLLTFLLLGSIGATASWWATRRLYSAVRVD